MAAAQERARVLCALIVASAEAGDLERAQWAAVDVETIGRSINEPFEQGRVLRSLAEALTAAGELERAEAIALSITHAPALGQALESLLMKVDRGKSRRVLTTALVTADPIPLLDSAAMIDPSALIETADRSSLRVHDLKPTTIL